MRMDDNGVTFEMKRSDKRDELEKLQKKYEGRGHKQTYWIKQAQESPPRKTT